MQPIRKEPEWMKILGYVEYTKTKRKARPDVVRSIWYGERTVGKKTRIKQQAHACSLSFSQSLMEVEMEPIHLQSLQRIGVSGLLLELEYHG